MKLTEIKEAFEDVRALGGLVALGAGLLNGTLVPVLPVAPAVHGLAILLVLVFCLLTGFGALSSTRDAPSGPQGNSRNRRWGWLWLIAGAIVLVLYFTGAAYLNNRQISSPVAATCLYALQAVAFAAPWAFWTAAGVMLWPVDKTDAP